jgi:hypothetical protein
MPASFRRVILVSCAYIALYGAAVVLWMERAVLTQHASLDTLSLGIPILPALLCLGVLGTHRGEPQQFLAKAMGCLLMLPLLVVYLASARMVALVPDAERESAVIVPVLDIAPLFAGAQRAAPVNMVQGPMRSLHTGFWSDHTEIHVMRFGSAEEAAAYLRFLSDSEHGIPTAIGARRGTQLRLPGATAFMYVEAIGSDVLQIVARDAVKAAAHIDVAGLPPSAAPPSVAAPARAQQGGQDRATAIVSFALWHVAIFVALSFWAVPRTTRVEATADIVPVEPSLLRERLQSLADATLGCVLRASDKRDRLVLEFVADGDEQAVHDFVLELAARARVVHVIERESYSGAPRSPEEAEMRAGGEVAVDPTRPKARWVGSITRSITYVDPARLEELGVTFVGTRAVLRNAPPIELNANHVAYALAAVITRSGYAYQPILFAWQRS